MKRALALALLAVAFCGCSAEDVRDRVYDATYPDKAKPDSYGSPLPGPGGTFGSDGP